MTILELQGGPHVVQVAPHGAGGVSDCVQHLQTAWQQQGWASQGWRLNEADVRASSLSERLLALQAGRAAPCVLVLHFSGYGYASRGLCAWLLRELEGARAALGRSFKLVSVFHELYATGPPWRSAFWTRPSQARIAMRLARLSDAVWTNTSLHAAWLARQAQPAAGVHVAPVFSNVGECGPVLNLAADRAPVMVVFGGTSTRLRACHAARGRRVQLAELGIEEVVEAGPGSAAWSAGPLPARHAGLLSAPELSALLQNARFGLLDYESRHLGKSSVFAAYAAHGCCAINTNAELESAEGLVPQHHYHGFAAAHAARHDLQDWTHMAQEAHRWYSQHSLAEQAQRWVRLLASLGKA